MTCSTTSRPSRTVLAPIGRRGPGWTVNCSVTLPFSMTSTRRPCLADDGAGIAADKGVAADVFAAFDGFEQEGLALPANLAIGGERRFQIGQNPARDRDQVALPGQFQKFRLRSDDTLTAAAFRFTPSDGASATMKARCKTGQWRRKPRCPGRWQRPRTPSG